MLSHLATSDSWLNGEGVNGNYEQFRDKFFELQKALSIYHDRKAKYQALGDCV